MWQLRRAVGVHAELEYDAGLALVGDGQSSRDQHQSFCRGVPVFRYGGVRGDSQEDIRVRLGGITVEDGQTAARRHEGWAWPPL